ncbi:WYL domain-containing protein [Cyanobacterium stanieri LEGE 03274]|uniref:WYL domain-containing protein n=1 Tax=Cyanobacterium stanieri LEGE 03274 TaxID=1828756 RepID=A0ABR9V3C6_9CHRO|nr:WYL domain-containing protein [Cyanobacterium stanieri]MBE9222401.1 WYL domain-containing protein [Cyanobacterium stanieri LEGE 03274]
MTRKNQAVTLSIGEREKKALENLALEFGKTWGDKPNVSKLIKAIALKQLKIIVNDDWNSQRIETLEKARKLLLDFGFILEAEEIARILIERSELQDIFITREIEQFLAKPKPLWRNNIENFIKRQQPFNLIYQDASENLWNFSIVHGQLKIIEKHQYLICTCQETEGNEDIIELKHNRTLRLDRIQEAVVNPLKLAWQPELDMIEVQFKLYGRLAFSYGKEEIKQDDIFQGEIEGNPPSRLIIRKVSSSFWFFREMAKYWDECEIIAPLSLREKFSQKLSALHQIYRENPSEDG